MHDDAVFLTPDERERFADKLRELTAALPEVQERLRRLAASGEDCDEDAYDDAQDELAGIAGSIDYLQWLLARAGTISADEARRADYVRLGSRVTVLTETGEEVAYQIVGLYEVDRSQGQPVTHRSPIGRALMGKRTGETATVVAPGGTFTLQVVRVEPPPSA